MKLKLIRNATLRLHYGGHLFIIDPFLAAKHARDSFTGKSRNPTVELPCTPEEAIADIKMILVSHLHADHFDPAAQELLPKDLPLFCQPGDSDTITSKGFQNVQEITESVTWNDITITRTLAQHGTGIWAEKMGNVMGFILQAEDEPTVYWSGDTIWYEPIAKTIADFQPDIIVTHSCGAQFEANSPIVMDAEQTVTVCKTAPHAKVVAVHMEALDHATLSRQDLRTFADSANISRDQLLIPDDGEVLTF
jgi:L-ascorbate metabolism protein UlaG (beta-lactamase superfamily)